MAPSLADWLATILKGAHSDAVPSIVALLKEQMCEDVDTLRECWDELKQVVPGVARKKITDHLEEERMQTVVIEGFYSIALWGRASTVAALLLALPAVIGFLKYHGTGSALGTDFEAQLMYEAWIPMLVLGVIELIAAMMLAKRIGYDMIEERSSDSGLRDTVRNNMSNQALIATLLLTVVWAMLQSDPPVDGGHLLFISQWYEGLLALATAFLLIAVMTCSFAILYVEPLDDLASFKFIVDNFLYVGEPLALTLVSLFNSICATIIWVFGAYGVGVGAVAAVVFAYAITRTYVVFSVLSRWKNPFISKEEKAKRLAMKKYFTTATRVDENREAKMRPA